MKTVRNEGDVDGFLGSIDDDGKRQDALEIRRLMEDVTGERGAMWGDSIIGFGQYHYRYETGREGDWFKVGFSPRAQNLTLYVMSGFDEYGALLERLGRHRTGKSCLYLKRLSDVDAGVLREIIARSVRDIESAYWADAGADSSSSGAG